jgi:hypothetical protein
VAAAALVAVAQVGVGSENAGLRTVTGDNGFC